MPLMRFLLLLVGAMLLLTQTACTRPSSISDKRPAQQPEPPRLVVLLVFDQMRGDYINRWQSLYGPGGFKRLCSEGAHFVDCHYPFANTMTGPGHATISTGCSPDKHGIVTNDWYDRTKAKYVYCAQGERYEQIPPPIKTKEDTEDGAKPTVGSASPENLLVETFADAFRAQYGKEARIVALSLKDRGAVLPANKSADLCLWADKDGRFVTSTYFAPSLPRWVADFNKSAYADRWMNKDWVRFNSRIDYEPHSGPDEVVGEGKGAQQGTTFPHPTGLGVKKPSKRNYYAAVATSPYGNDLLFEVTKRAITEYKLGSDKTPDYLEVSFSSNDLVGHAWGPDSQEVLDITLQSDAMVANLLNLLDEKVGKGKYVVALTADHGICPLPEVMAARGFDAKRLDFTKLFKEAEEFLDTEYPLPAGEKAGQGKWLEATKSLMVYLNRKRLAQRKIAQEEVEEKLAKWFAKSPGLAAAFTRTQLMKSEKPIDALEASVRRSFHADRSGDVLLVMKKYWLPSDKVATGTTHGAPYDYDTHVPLVVMGPRVLPATHKTRVSPELTAVLMAELAGLKPLANAEVTVPEGVLDK
jgi:predicted AlkP superfamily pyrophosphatase or phosphodiesterase